MGAAQQVADAVDPRLAAARRSGAATWPSSSDGCGSATGPTASPAWRAVSPRRWRMGEKKRPIRPKASLPLSTATSARPIVMSTVIATLGEALLGDVVVNAEGRGPDQQRRPDAGGDDDRVDRLAALLRPVDVVEVHPEGELVQGEGGADAEDRAEHLQPGRCPAGRRTRGRPRPGSAGCPTPGGGCARRRCGCRRRGPPRPPPSRRPRTGADAARHPAGDREGDHEGDQHPEDAGPAGLQDGLPVPRDHARPPRSTRPRYARAVRRSSGDPGAPARAGATVARPWGSASSTTSPGRFRTRARPARPMTTTPRRSTPTRAP